MLVSFFSIASVITLLELPDQFSSFFFFPIWIKWLVGWLDIAFVFLCMIPLQGQILIGYNEDHWKGRQELSIVNDYFCSRSQRPADSSTNHRIISVCFSVQQWLRACVWLQWGELPEWVLPAAGCLQTAEWDTCDVWRIMCHRYVCDPPSACWMNSKSKNYVSCFFCYLEINNSDYILARQASYSFIQSMHYSYSMSFCISNHFSKKEKIYHKDIGGF